MAEPPQKKVRYTVAEQTVDHIKGRSLGQLLNEERYWIVRDKTFEHIPTKELIALRKTSKTKKEQIDKYLLTVRYKNWDLSADDDYIYLISLYVFFDFDPRYSIDDQVNNKFEKIFMITAKSKRDVPWGLRTLLENDILDEHAYLIIPNGTEEIEEEAFWPGGGNRESSITKVWTPPSLTFIDNNAFNSCKNLSKIRFSPNLEIIDSYAFYGCKKLKEVTFPSSLHHLSHGCFSNSGLESIKFRESFKLTIAGNAFHSCSKLKDVVLPSNLRKIGRAVFAHTALEEIVIPPNVTEIGAFCFSDCINLRTVDIQANIKLINEALFNECEQLQHVRLPKSVNDIEKHAFFNTALTFIDLGPNIVNIDERAFFNTKLTRIHFSKNLYFIYKEAFSNSKLEHVSFSRDIDSDNEEFYLSPDVFENTPIESVECSYKLFQKWKTIFSKSTTKQIKFHFYGEAPDVILNTNSLKNS